MREVLEVIKNLEHAKSIFMRFFDQRIENILSVRKIRARWLVNKRAGHKGKGIELHVISVNIGFPVAMVEFLLSQKT